MALMLTGSTPLFYTQQTPLAALSSYALSCEGPFHSM